jgi:hypothetical protein
VTEDLKVSVTAHGDRKRASTGSVWEPKVGYSRAVRVGNHIAVTGTVGVEADGRFAMTVEAQTRRALTIIMSQTLDGGKKSGGSTARSLGRFGRRRRWLRLPS